MNVIKVRKHLTHRQINIRIFFLIFKRFCRKHLAGEIGPYGRPTPAHRSQLRYPCAYNMALNLPCVPIWQEYTEVMILEVHHRQKVKDI